MDKEVDMRKRAEKFWSKKSKKESALYALYDYLSHCLLSVFDEIESHFAEDSIRRNEKFSIEIVYYGGMDGDSLETLGKYGIFRAREGSSRFSCSYGYAHGVYRLSLDAEAYREMKEIVGEVYGFIQRGKQL